MTEVANTANGLAGSTNAAASSSLSSDAVTEFEVKIKILNSSYADLSAKLGSRGFPFKPGMTASVEIITDRRSGVLSVPIAAVTTRADSTKMAAKRASDTDDEPTTAAPKTVKEIVFVAENGKAAQREVKTGISDFENIQIVSGLKKGDQVIAGPFLAVSKKLKPGDLVVKRDPNKVKKE